jgi:hypothetical protein
MTEPNIKSQADIDTIKRDKLIIISFAKFFNVL